MTGQTTLRQQVISELLDTLRTDGGVRVVTGEPGCGRTAFLRHAARLFRAGPVWHLRPADGSTAEALSDALCAAARTAPLLVCADDAHLWDEAARAALARAAARVHAAGIRAGLLLTVPGHRPVDPELAALPVLRLGPLTAGDAERLADDASHGAVHPAVREELVTAAEGNPALLLALVDRLAPAQLAGHRALPRPLADGEVLAGVVGGALTGVPPDRRSLLLTAAAALWATGEPDADADLVLRADGTRAAEPLPEVLVRAGDRLRFRSPLLGRAVYAGAPAERRRAAHRALTGALPDPEGILALLHRSWTVTGHAPALSDALARAAADPAPELPPVLRHRALTRAAALTPDDAARVHRCTAAAEQAALAGHPSKALRLLDAARRRPAPAAARGGAELLRGAVLLADGPVDDARESFLLAATLLSATDPEAAATATLGAADAAWSAGDPTACLEVLTPAPAPPARTPPSGTDGTDAAASHEAVLRDHRDGMRAVLLGEFGRAAVPLRRVVERGLSGGDPERLLRSASAALMLGDVTTARRAGARALAAARTHGRAALEPRALEYLAYAELRAGRHQLARTHAEEGLRTASRTGQRNTAAHHHAALALAASIEGEREVVAEHTAAALRTARRHGLAQAAALAEWAAARADLGGGRPREAADRLGPLVRPGARRGHFAVWMLAVPCFVEAAALAGRPEHARAVVDDFALWAACGADPQAPAQLLRCRALLAAPEAADALYRRALERHEDTAGDFERARTALLYGKWLRRRRRLREARARLGEALMGFERCGAHPWMRQTAAELRAGGAAPAGGGSGALSRLTPQQLRIARCVAEGATNREVALSLSVSTRTVDYHLRNVFATLGVRSRVELVRLVEHGEKTGAQL
ncbi:helix-turn-helix transcriptional regulator [Streptomyces pilosus]|uniref:Helix-turn-helix transcriptional regulator n=1 Tax=Streptomyces pilosus TaxID=28893 RepID=A0A918BHD6_9ACTN|nr:helix-turn-helix transcriptional regulator [Streptomyces pilosus]GGQ69111.1 helix-turn-helix transcriptional regulator [Streptomyces pilosus]GGV54526.1 helix-turn-helix transcriptional regulator [Streptomyces pilosus]